MKVTETQSDKQQYLVIGNDGYLNICGSLGSAHTNAEQMALKNRGTIYWVTSVLSEYMVKFTPEVVVTSYPT